MLTNMLITGGAKDTFNHAVLNIGIRCTIDNFNNALMDMTKYVFPTYAFNEQQMYLRRHLLNKTKSMILHTFISRLQEMNACFGELHPETL